MFFPINYITKTLQVIIINNHATGVLFDYNGQTYQVHARREVILSAGAINTPKLLMLSGIGPEEHLRQFNVSRMYRKFPFPEQKSFNNLEFEKNVI